MQWLKNLFCNAPPRLHRPDQRITSYILKLRWHAFEQYVADLLSRIGYESVVVTGRDGPDGGKDILITHQNKRYLVQCKHWARDCITVSHLREFYAVMTEFGADGGYFVTLLGFTPAAREYARNKAIRLVTLPTLVQWQQLIETHQAKLADIAIHDPQAPRCPAGTLMKKRQGPHGEFWGCGEWPNCVCKSDQSTQEKHHDA